MFRAGRILFGAVLAFMALDNFRNREQMVEYARSKQVPFPELAVPTASGTLLFGSAGLALWRAPALAASAIASFFIGITPTMHDFWNQEGEEKQTQTIHFLKNTALLGATLSFYGLGEARSRDER